MNSGNLTSTIAPETTALSQMWRIDLLVIGLVVCLPNVLMTIYNEISSVWFTTNLFVLIALIGLRAYFLQPLRRIVQHVHMVRTAYHREMGGDHYTASSLRSIAYESTRFACFFVDYLHKYNDLNHELALARQLIKDFTIQQELLLTSTSMEVALQYRHVLAYAHYLDEQILENKIDQSMRYDFDDICESSFNLKIIAESLALLSTPHTQHPTTVIRLATVIQQTLLSLSSTLDRRSMKLTTENVDLTLDAHANSELVLHMLWMILLGMIRYAANESTLTLTCHRNAESKRAVVSITINELSPTQLSMTERHDHLTRQLQQRTPHMFAETIAIHANIQLAELLISRMHGTIGITPLTDTSCKLCLYFAAA